MILQSKIPPVVGGFLLPRRPFSDFPVAFVRFPVSRSFRLHSARSLHLSLCLHPCQVVQRRVGRLQVEAQNACRFPAWLSVFLEV